MSLLMRCEVGQPPQDHSLGELGQAVSSHEGPALHAAHPACGSHRAGVAGTDVWVWSVICGTRE